MSEKLILENYLPYRLSVLSNRVSGGVSRQYQPLVDLSIPEWRVIAILGENAALSAGGVARKTAMDKVAVSRAAARLEDVGYIKRAVDKEDKRRQVISLTKKGRKVYETVVPVALDYEKALLENLTKEEKEILNLLLSKLTQIEEELSL